MKKIINVIIGILLIGLIALSVILFMKNKELQEEYDDLSIDYENKSSEYEALMTDYISVNTDKNTLQTDYDTLQSDYNELKALYDAETSVEYETPTDLSQYATDISYEDIARTPDDYEGKALCYTGEVIQVLENDGETDLRVALGDWYEDVILCGYDPKITDKRVLEGDTVTVYGIYHGIYTYESTMGTDISLPLLWLDHIEIN